MRHRITGDGIRSLLTTLPSERTTFDDLTLMARLAEPGLTESAVARAVRSALREGDVMFYDIPSTEATAIVLTPLGAAREGVRLNVDSTAWVPTSMSDPVSYSMSADLLKDDGSAWGEIDRRTPLPIDRLISLEEDAIQTKPSPCLLLLGLTDPRPLPTTPYPQFACPLHPGRLPRPGSYCLWCDAGVGPTRRPKRPRAVRLPRELGVDD